MRCPTCGRQVARNEDVCRFCGALVTAPAPVFAGVGSGPQFRVGSQPSPASSPPDIPFDAPVFEDDAATEQAPAAPPPIVANPGSRRPTPGTKSPIAALIRLAFVVLFLLVPLLRFLTRDFSLNTQGARAAVLREALLCSSVANGHPQNPKTVFSASHDQEAVLYSSWTGERENHTFSVRWSSLEAGSIRQEWTTGVEYQDNPDGFVAVGRLKIQPGMRLGRWRTELSVDQKVRAAIVFRVVE
jgi:hypothetical protein